MSDRVTEELLQLNQKLLDSIAQADWATYQEMCDAGLTAFEPEAQGQLVQGLAFHHFYFRLGAGQGAQQMTMCSPHVRLVGDVAVVTYVRLNQHQAADGTPVVRSFEETRVWHKQSGRWTHVHFHRSVPFTHSTGASASPKTP
jgi:calcium/calmodulin-dependent protein kinase (CaM kinase) II